jgi:hypothetical protein
MPRRSGLVSASVLAMVLVGAFSGALVGLVLASMLGSQGLLAVIAAFVAVVLALLVGHTILGTHAELSLQSGPALWNIAISSLMGALAGHELSVDLRSPPPSPLVGSMSGLLAALLIVSFAITIFWLKNRPSER